MKKREIKEFYSEYAGFILSAKLYLNDVDKESWSNKSTPVKANIKEKEVNGVAEVKNDTKLPQIEISPPNNIKDKESPPIENISKETEAQKPQTSNKIKTPDKIVESDIDDEIERWYQERIRLGKEKAQKDKLNKLSNNTFLTSKKSEEENANEDTSAEELWTDKSKPMTTPASAQKKGEFPVIIEEKNLSPMYAEEELA